MTINLNSQLVLTIRRLIYWCGGLLSRLFLLKPKVAILCYHSISTDGWRFSTSPEDLKKHIGYIMQNFRVITLDDVHAYLSGKKTISKPSVAITFDDGYQDLVSQVSYFKKMGIKPAVFALSDPSSVNRSQMGSTKPLLTAANLKTLANAGWTIGSHGATHADFARLGPKAVKKEITLAKRALEKIIKKPVKYFAYPKGRFSQKIIDQLKKAGFLLALSMDSDVVKPHYTNPYAVPRIGIDASHSPAEFQNTLQPINIYLRRRLAKFSLNYEIS